MAQFTVDEVATLAKRVVPPVFTVDRSSPPTGDELLQGVSDMVGRALNADTDGVFYLTQHLAHDTRAVALALVRNVADFQRFASAAQADAPAVASRVGELLDLLDQIEQAPAGQRDRLVAQYSRLSERYARSSHTQAGVRTVRISPAEARAGALQSLDAVVASTRVLLDNMGRFLTALDVFSRTDWVRATRLRVIRHARSILQPHGNRRSDDQAPAIIDALLVDGMLAESVAQPDPRQDKYVGGAQMLAQSGTKSRQVTLTDAMRAASPIRPGDYVFLEGTLRAAVAWSEGADIYLGVNSYLLLNPASAGIIEVRIRSASAVAYEAVCGNIAPLSTQLQQASADLTAVARRARTYIEAGAGTASPVELLALSAYAGRVADALSRCTASGVAAVENLLDHLQTERLGPVADALVSCRFYLLHDIGNLLSAPAQIADAARVVEEQLDVTDVDVQTRQTHSMLADYFRTGGS